MSFGSEHGHRLQLGDRVQMDDRQEQVCCHQNVGQVSMRQPTLVTY